MFAEEVTTGWTATLAPIGAAIALFFAWLMARDRLRHDEKLIRLEKDNECLRAELDKLKGK